METDYAAKTHLCFDLCSVNHCVVEKLVKKKKRSFVNAFINAFASHTMNFTSCQFKLNQTVTQEFNFLLSHFHWSIAT